MMPEPTPSQLKIDGIVTVPGGEHFDKEFELDFSNFINDHAYKFQGTISPLNPDAESFMRLYRVEEVEALKKSITSWQQVVTTMTDAAEANDKAYSDLAEQLRVTQRSLDMHKHSLEETQKESREQIFNLTQENKALELRLRVKDSPIKAGLKRIWKWFKGLVGK